MLLELFFPSNQLQCIVVITICKYNLTCDRKITDVSDVYVARAYKISYIRPDVAQPLKNEHNLGVFYP